MHPSSYLGSVGIGCISRRQWKGVLCGRVESRDSEVFCCLHDISWITHWMKESASQIYHYLSSPWFQPNCTVSFTPSKSCQPPKLLKGNFIERHWQTGAIPQNKAKFCRKYLLLKGKFSMSSGQHISMGDCPSTWVGINPSVSEVRWGVSVSATRTLYIVLLGGTFTCSVPQSASSPSPYVYSAVMFDQIKLVSLACMLVQLVECTHRIYISLTALMFTVSV